MSERRSVATSAAPAAIGPYSQAVQVGEWLFTAGQLGMDPSNGELVPGGVAGETRRALRNLEAILTEAGFSLAEVVKTTVFLADMAEFPAMNAVYEEVFSEPYPARSTVQAAGLPRGARVEIEAVARHG